MLQKTFMGFITTIVLLFLVVNPVQASSHYSDNTGNLNVVWDDSIVNDDLFLISWQEPHEPETAVAYHLDESAKAASLTIPAGPFTIGTINSSCYDSGSLTGDCISTTIYESDSCFSEDDGSTICVESLTRDLNPYVRVGKTSSLKLSLIEESVFTAPDSVSVPSQEELTNISTVANYKLSQTSYITGQSFNIKITDLVSKESGNVVDGSYLSLYGYSEPVNIGNANIVSGAFSFNIPQQYTTNSHTIIALDNFGRLIVKFKLENGVITNYATSDPNPVKSVVNPSNVVKDTVVKSSLAQRLPATGANFDMSLYVVMGVAAFISGGALLFYRRRTGI